MSDTERVVELMALIGPDRCANAPDVVLALDAALAGARDDERDAIVDYLRRMAGLNRDGGLPIRGLAHRIERGAHRRRVA